MPTKKKLSIKSADEGHLQASSSDNFTSDETSQAQSREEQVRLAAYLAAERRGFAPGYEVDDWITAENEVDAAARNSGTEA